MAITCALLLATIVISIMSWEVQVPVAVYFQLVLPCFALCCIGCFEILRVLESRHIIAWLRLSSPLDVLKALAELASVDAGKHAPDENSSHPSVENSGEQSSEDSYDHSLDALYALHAAGHLNGPMYDLGDTPVCAAVIGIPEAPFCFEQAMLRTAHAAGPIAGGLQLACSAEALAAFNAVDVGHGPRPHRAIAAHASWLDGEPATEPSWLVPAESTSYGFGLAICTSHIRKDGAVVLHRVIAAGPALHRALVIASCVILLVWTGVATLASFEELAMNADKEAALAAGEVYERPLGGGELTFCILLLAYAAMLVVIVLAILLGFITVVRSPLSGKTYVFHFFLAVHMLCCVETVLIVRSDGSPLQGLLDFAFWFGVAGWINLFAVYDEVNHNIQTSPLGQCVCPAGPSLAAMVVPCYCDRACGFDDNPCKDFLMKILVPLFYALIVVPRRRTIA